ncbi:MAG: PAS domain S-box protein [Candidatus Omnitrophota bacterium]|jgi:PAS domain S-box-containing protein
MTVKIPDRQREVGFPIRTGLPWLVLFLGATVALLIAGYTYYTHEADRVGRQKYDEIKSIAKLKAKSIQEWRKGLLEDVRALARGPLWKGAVNEWFREPKNDALLTGLMDRLVVGQQQGGYADALLIDSDGNVILSTSGQPESMNAIEKMAIEEAVASGSPVLSDMYRNLRGAILMDAVAPILDPKGRSIAVGLYRVDPESFLFPLIQTWPTPSQSAETLLVRRDGDDVLFLNDLRRRPNTALSFREPITLHDLPAVQAILGKEGLFEGKDYRGEEVLAYLGHIPDSLWFIVAKVDKSEILKGPRFRGIIAALFAGTLILAAAAGSAYGYRHRQDSMYKELYRLEKERQLLEERYQTILYSIGDAVITTDTGTLVQEMNPAAERLTGWTEDEAKGKAIDEIFHTVDEDSHEPNPSSVQLVLTEGIGVRLPNDALLIARDGAEHPIADSAAPISHDGAISGVVLIFRDQTEQKAIRRALEKSEGTVRAIFESASDGIISFDDQGTIEMVNPAMERLFGYTAQEIVGRNVKLLMPDFYSIEQDEYPKPQLEAFETEVIERTSNTIGFRKDGGTFPVEISVSEYSSKHGGHSAAFVRDITGRVKAEGDRAFLASIVDSSDEAIIGNNLDGTIVSWNREAQKMYGFTAEEAKGQSIRAIIPQRLHSQIAYLLGIVGRGERTENIETARVAKDGREIPVLLSLSPIKDSFGKILGASEIARDISQIKQYEQELRLAKESSETANRAKSEFLTSMSHELRTPLNSVIGFSEVLHDKTFGDLNARQTRYVDNILIAGHQLLSLINDILDLAKIEARKTELLRSEVKVKKILEECVLLVREKALNRNLDLSLHAQDDLLVWADERSLKQIILNLLSNATKFTPDGGKLSVTAEKKQGELVFSVRDNGIGVKLEDQERIFDEFEQVDTGTSRKFQGTGLGLALTRKLVELHGGKIWIESEGEGSGSVFSFTIPCAHEATG